MNVNRLFSYFLLILLVDCSQIKPRHEELQQLHYSSDMVESDLISCSINAKATINHPELDLDIELTNQSSSEVIVRRIRIETVDGIQAKLKNDESSYKIINGKEKWDTTLSYTPINDYQLFALTGNNGPFLQSYHVIIDHEIDNQIKTERVEIRMLKGDYDSYSQNNQHSFFAFKFKDDSLFIAHQEEYLRNNIHGTTFVNITDNELAIAGLNFRAQAYWEHDTLHANMFVVNHAEFPVAIDTSTFDITHKNTENIDRIVKINKIGGDQHEPSILRNGDRLVIGLKRLMKEVPADNLDILLVNTFILPNGNSLFSRNPELVKLQ